MFAKVINGMLRHESALYKEGEIVDLNDERIAALEKLGVVCRIEDADLEAATAPVIEVQVDTETAPDFNPFAEPVKPKKGKR